MKITGKFTLLLCLVLVSIGFTLALAQAPVEPEYAPASLWYPGPQAVTYSPLWLFRDARAYKKGDLVTILVSESVVSSLSGNTKTSKKTQGAGQHGTGMLSLLGAYGYGNSDSFTASGSSTHTDKLAATVTAVVEEVLPNGVLRVKGSRLLSLNGDTRTLELSGLVRQEDIGPGNTVSSASLADAKMVLTGKGPIAHKKKPGILSRLFDFLF